MTQPRRGPLKADEIVEYSLHLTEIPQLYRQLPTIDEPERPDAGEANDAAPGTEPGSRAPLNLAVIHLEDTRYKTGWRAHDPGRVASIHRFGVLPSLTWWTQYIDQVMGERDVIRPVQANPATVATECAWLTDVTTFVLAQPWAVTCVRDIGAIHDRLADTVTGKQRWIPKCGTCATNGRRSTLEPQDDGSWYKCPHCNREYTPGSMSDLGRRQPPMLGRTIAEQLDIPWSTFRNWDGNLIHPVRRDSKGRKLYNLADALRIKERVRDRSEHRRRRR